MKIARNLLATLAIVGLAAACRGEAGREPTRTPTTTATAAPGVASLTGTHSQSKQGTRERTGHGH